MHSEVQMLRLRTCGFAAFHDMFPGAALASPAFGGYESLAEPTGSVAIARIAPERVVEVCGPRIASVRRTRKLHRAQFGRAEAGFPEFRSQGETNSMLRQVKELNGYKLGARDGEIGHAREFYFEDVNWTVRYLVADTGNWLMGRRVLISPYALDPVRQTDKIIPVELTKKQIENAPALDTEKPVSRQYELEYYSFYGWPAYWDGTEVWGNLNSPNRGSRGWSDASRKNTNDPHLRSTKDVFGHSIQALDGEIGHIEDFVVDDETWVIRYLVVDTKNWLPGKRVLIATDWIDRISWEESKIFLHLTRDEIREAPEYTKDVLITREYEEEVHRHYNRAGYWFTAVPA